MQQLKTTFLTICEHFFKENPPWDHAVLTCDQAIETPHVVMKNANEGEIWAFKMGVQYGIDRLFEHFGQTLGISDDLEDLQKKYMHVKTQDK